MKIPRLISRYRDKVSRSIFIQNIAIVAGGNTVAKLIGILTAPVITRLYTTEDYGIFSVLLAVIGIVGSLSTMRYAVTIPLAKDEKMSDNLIRLCWLVTSAFTLLWTVGIILFGEKISVRFSVEKAAPYLWILPVVFLGKGLYETLSNWAVREKSYKLISRTKITQDASSAAIKMGLGAIGIKPLGLFVGHLAMEYAGIGSLLIRLLKKKPGFFRYFSWSEIKEAAIRYKKFPLVQSWSQMLLSLAAQLPVVFMGTLYGAGVAGVFGLAQNMINMPMNLLGQSVAQVYYGEISKYGKGNPGKIYNLTISVVKKMLWIAILPLLSLIAFGPWIFGIVFGSEWYDAGVYARIISSLILFRFISTPVINCLNVLEMQGIQLFMNLLRSGMIVSIFFIGGSLNWNPQKTLAFYSAVISFFYLFVIIIVLRILKRKKQTSDQLLG